MCICYEIIGAGATQLFDQQSVDPIANSHLQLVRVHYLSTISRLQASSYLQIPIGEAMSAADIEQEKAQYQEQVRFAQPRRMCVMTI